MDAKTLVRKHGRRLVKHGGLVLLSLLCLEACSRWVPRPILESAGAVAGNFLQTFGGIYGVVVAFVIFVTWQQHNDTQVALEHEAISVSEVFMLVGCMDDFSGRRDVQRFLAEYVDKVLPREDGKVPDDNDGAREQMEHALRLIARYAPGEGQDRLYGPVLDLFHELNEAREHRSTISRLRLPEALKAFVYIGGFINIASVWLLWVDNSPIPYLLTAGMTWVIVALTSLILDLDDPHHGDFVVDWKRFEQVRAAMRRELSLPA